MSNVPAYLSFAYLHRTMSVRYSTGLHQFCICPILHRIFKLRRSNGFLQFWLLIRCFSWSGLARLELHFFYQGTKDGKLRSSLYDKKDQQDPRSRPLISPHPTMVSSNIFDESWACPNHEGRPANDWVSTSTDQSDVYLSCPCTLVAVVVDDGEGLAHLQNVL